MNNVIGESEDERGDFLADKERCERCEGDGSYSELAPCTTLGRDCACNGPRVIVDPCPRCLGTGIRGHSRPASLESLSKAELIAKVRTADAMYRLLAERLDNASKTIRAYQRATGTDYPGSLREHQKVPDLFAAGRAFREQWGLPDLFAGQSDTGS